jgi:DNA-binding MarR family transcriptional regulator
MTTRPSSIQRELKQTRPFASAAQEAAVSLLRTADVLRSDLERALGPHGITAQQYNVLRILRGALPESMPTLEVGARLIERQPGVTRLLDRIEARGLVTRQRCREDRRRVLCRITPAGLKALEAADAPLNRIEAQRLGRLRPAEIATLIRLLDRLREESG